MKDEAPPGEVIYEKDGYAIHELDGEDHKVCATTSTSVTPQLR